LRFGSLQLCQHSVFFINADTGFVAGEMVSSQFSGGHIYKTVNGGVSWTQTFSGVNAALYSIFFPDILTGYAVGQLGKIAKTTNGGSDWTLMSSGTAKRLFSVYFSNPHIGYITGEDGTIFKTTDEGLTWASQPSGTTRDLTSVCFTDPLTGYAVGQTGTILKTTSGGVGTEEITAEEPFRVYPNPATEFIVVERRNPEHDHCEFIISDIFGRKILSGKMGMSTGYKLNVNDFASGIYFLTMKSDYGKVVKKFVIQHE
jgi:photosystem II stability/assembly factor-like uncharacterized protein